MEKKEIELEHVNKFPPATETPSKIILEGINDHDRTFVMQEGAVNRIE